MFAYLLEQLCNGFKATERHHRGDYLASSSNVGDFEQRKAELEAHKLSTLHLGGFLR